MRMKMCMRIFDENSVENFFVETWLIYRYQQIYLVSL